MDKINKIKISDFTYNLPDERIARYPLAERDKSKLLLWKNGTISETIFEDCTNHLPEKSQLVFNNTRVIHARLFFRKATGAKIEIFCLEPVKPVDYQLAFQQSGHVVWKCMVGNSKKWKAGVLSREIEIKGEKMSFKAEKTAQNENTYNIKFSWNKPVTFSEIIEHAGELPIPPYLNRETENSDEENYQTVYAKIDGSVAAPTAGLHFTEKILKNFGLKNIAAHEITLHVGAGTFQPVKSETIAGHTMHNEKAVVSKNILKSLCANLTNIIAVGTTSVRTLESLFWLGVQLENGSFNEDFPFISQWEPYKQLVQINTKKALQNILAYLQNTDQESIGFSTQIIIVPGYNFRVINGMFTNFHQPQSTLLLLVGAFLGREWVNVYQFALNNNFRFLSYGDTNLYLR